MGGRTGRGVTDGERGGERGGGGEGAGGGEVQEREAEARVAAQLAQLELERHGAALGLGMRRAGAGEGVRDHRSVEVGRDEREDAVVALQDLLVPVGRETSSSATGRVTRVGASNVRVLRCQVEMEASV